MDGPVEYYTQLSQAEKGKYYITYMQNLQNSTNESIYKTETDSDIENKLMVNKGEREGRRDKLGIWD